MIQVYWQTDFARHRVPDHVLSRGQEAVEYYGAVCEDVDAENFIMDIEG
jgi:hypothetical protein